MMNRMERFNRALELAEEAVEAGLQIQHAPDEKTRQELKAWAISQLDVAHLVLTTNMTEEEAIAQAYGQPSHQVGS